MHSPREIKLRYSMFVDGMVDRLWTGVQLPSTPLNVIVKGKISMLSKQFVTDYIELLTLFRKSDKRYMRFGALGHRYKLHNPISETDLIKLSKNLRGYGLPRDYYDYLTKIADGGFSSCYGLLPIEKTIQLIVKRASNEDAKKLDDFLVIERAGCNFYVLLKLTGKNAGVICHATANGNIHDIEIEETTLPFKLYLLDSFFKDEKFIKDLKREDKELHTRLMKYFEDYERLRPRTDYETFKELGLL